MLFVMGVTFFSESKKCNYVRISGLELDEIYTRVECTIKVINWCNLQQKVYGKIVDLYAEFAVKYKLIFYQYCWIVIFSMYKL